MLLLRSSTLKRRPMKKVYPCIYFLLYSFLLHAQQYSDETARLLEGRSSIERVRVLNRYITANNDREKINTLLQNATSFARKHHDEYLLKELRFLKQRRAALFETDSHKRIDVYRHILRDREFKDHALYKAICLHQIGQNQFVLEKYGQALENSLSAQKIFRKLGYENVPNIGKYLHDLALDYYFFRNYEEVIKVMKTSVELPAFDDNLDIQRYNTLGMAYLKSGVTDSAVTYLRMAYKKAAHYRDTIWMGLVSGNIGEVYYAKQDYQKALPYFLKNYEWNKNTYQHFEIPLEANADLAKTYLKTDSLQRAYQLMVLTESYFPENQVFQFGEQQGVEVAKRQHYENLYLYYLKSSDYKKAILYRDSLAAVEKAVNGKYNTALAKMTQDQLQIQENRDRIARQEKENIAIRFRYSVFIGVASLLAVLGFTLYYIVRLRKRKEKQLWARQQQIEALEHRNTRQALKHARSKLDNLAQKIRENRQVIDQLQETQNTTKDSLLDELKNRSILTPKDWNTFKKSFNEVYPDFITRLTTLYPDLTRAELRCLCLGKLEITNNEMALMSGVSANTILVTQHRIRKKLDLNDRKELHRFVRSL
ncbi:hypothetical protein SAMN02927921_00440 [Sinomicrobium oceani]|uniref:Uncharacterized protein n=1 Tax=Sinomicrobium oceani TaxID=1150368 RepID=A0A1K1M6Z6_9FLAO|nr:hypothetical protein [Sinomicrobium oceani]SFW18946.1 hypothetical protein SAMN02927921_00440 [Sinomicrobium oceani]